MNNGQHITKVPVTSFLLDKKWKVMLYTFE